VVFGRIPYRRVFLAAEDVCKSNDRATRHSFLCWNLLLADLPSWSPRLPIHSGAGSYFARHGPRLCREVRFSMSLLAGSMAQAQGGRIEIAFMIVDPNI
jgi:hypothetical protein